MSDPTLEAAIAEAYASAPNDVVILHTLEIRHNSLSVPIRVVRDYEDLYATLESDAPVNAGEEVLFQKFAFDFKLPKVDDGGIQRLEITFENASQLITQALEQVVVSTDLLEITYRPYLSTDTSAPQMDPPLTLNIVDVRADIFRITAVAEFKALHNIRFPRNNYTLENYPSLA